MNRAARDAWTACPPGEFVRLTDRLRGRKRRRRAFRATALAMVLIAGVGIWAARSSLSGPREHAFAGIRCSQVLELARAYAEGSLEPNRAEQVRAHVAQCPNCHERFEAMGLLSRALLDLGHWLTHRIVYVADDGPVPLERDQRPMSAWRTG